MKIVPDTSVIIDGRITSLITSGEYSGAKIIIPEAVVAELESQANQGREIGYSGLVELQNLCKFAEEGQIEIEFIGVRPTLEQVKLASGGEIDALIRKVAIDHNAKFITSDVVQSEVAKAKGLDVLYLKPQMEEFTPLGIDSFFDEYTIAVYLKERAAPFAKKGTISKTELVQIRENPTSEYELRGLAQEVIERAKRDPDGFIELEKRSVTVVQIGSMRITITRRPFSDGMEITAVRPIVDMSLEDFSHSDKIKQLLLGKKGGILIAGSPGSGKTTYAQSIAIFLSDKGNVVKTMESPRELQVPDNITQYTTLEGSMQNTAEVLVLVRPDYVIFDELRKEEDFRVFSDMRLAGINMVGVVHASSPHEALRRFSDRVDFSVLPQIFTTMVFLKDGQVNRILTTDFNIKNPEGMTGDKNLRPVTTISDFTTKKADFEIFRYENEPIVVPVVQEQKPEKTVAKTSEITAIVPETEKAIEKSTQPAFVENKEEEITKKPVAKETNHKPDSEPEANKPKPTEKPLSKQVQEIIPQEPAEEEEDEEEDEGISWEITERDIQREISRYTNKDITVEMTSATKAVVYIEDKDVPAAIGKGGKNISAIVNKVGVGIDIRPMSDLEKSKLPAPPTEEEIKVGEGINIRVDKKNLAIISHENTGKIVDVFAGRKYLFTATVNDDGEIHLSKNSTIAQEMIRRHDEGEPIRIKAV